MFKDTDLVMVRNRNNGTTGYTLDGGNFHRDFSINESKRVPFSELKELSYAPGGQFILDNYLVVEDKDALEQLNMHVEPEYFYDESKVKNILFNGSLDEFADFLDFAPAGAIEIAKNIAIKEKIFDTRKRELLSEKTGLNINNAIMINDIMDADDEKKEEAPKKRRVQVEEEKKADEPKERRTETPQKIVVKK